jgi:prepilin-type N-terminal cleavage/methylation domain-containing protein
MKTNKKGFTLVELVIVIAVIAILAAVLLPTFSGIIARAKLNSATQRAASARDEFHSTYFASMEDVAGTTIYVVENNTVAAAANYTVKYGFTVGTNGQLTEITSLPTITNKDADEVTISTTDYSFVKYGTDVIVVYTTAIADKMA